LPLGHALQASRSRHSPSVGQQQWLEGRSYAAKHGPNAAASVGEGNDPTVLFLLLLQHAREAVPTVRAHEAALRAFDITERAQTELQRKGAAFELVHTTSCGGGGGGGEGSDGARGGPKPNLVRATFLQVYPDIKKVSVRVRNMNMILHNITRFTIENGDTLEDPLILENGQVRKFDRVLANPPFSQNYSRSTMKFTSRFREYCPETGKKADLMFVQHMIASLKPDAIWQLLCPTGCCSGVARKS